MSNPSQQRNVQATCSPSYYPSPAPAVSRSPLTPPFITSSAQPSHHPLLSLHHPLRRRRSRRRRIHIRPITPSRRIRRPRLLQLDPAIRPIHARIRLVPIRQIGAVLRRRILLVVRVIPVERPSRPSRAVVGRHTLSSAAARVRARAEKEGEEEDGDDDDEDDPADPDVPGCVVALVVLVADVSVGSDFN
jgi:hypothetical protein